MQTPNGVSSSPSTRPSRKAPLPRSAREARSAPEARSAREARSAPRPGRLRCPRRLRRRRARGLTAGQVEDALDLAHHPLGPLPELLEPLQGLADPVRYPVGRIPVPARRLAHARGSRRPGRTGRTRAAAPVALVVNLADPVVRVMPGLPALFLRLVGFLFGQVGLFLRQVGLFLRQVGLPLGPVGPPLRLLRRGPGLVGPPLRLLLLLLVSPLPGEGGGFCGHIGGVVRHHGRLVRPLGAFPGSFGPLPHLVGPLPLLVRPLPCAQAALVPRPRRPRRCCPRRAVRDGRPRPLCSRSTACLATL